MLNNIRVLIGVVLLLPQILVFLYVTYSGGEIFKEDLIRWKQIKGLTSKGNLIF